jgi:hypothetical protein
MGIGPGLGWGIVGIVLLTLLIGYVVVQETRAHRHWRGLVAAGDVDAIRSIVQDALEAWRAGRPPRGVPANIWSAIQTAQLVDTGPDFVRLSTGVEGQYAMVDGHRSEVSSSFEEAAKVARKLGDMMLYDIPDLALPYVQVDVYSTFRDEQERPEQHCILSTIIDRSRAGDFDWDEGTSRDLIDAFESRYRLNDAGVALPIEPLNVESARPAAGA